MRYSAVALTLVAFFVASSVYFAEARPGKRLDERTKMCRVIADGGALDWNSEPWGTGGKQFRAVCKSCHTRDNDKGATFLHAESYTSDAWNAIFAKRKTVCAKNGSWAVLSEDDIQMVNDYLFRNANWTYDPNDADSCG